MAQARRIRKTWIIALAIAGAFALGYLLNGDGGGGPVQHEQTAAATGGTEAATTWTCSMHPQIQQPNPGQCPICGMDLIPVSDDSGDDIGPRQIRLSETAQKLASVRTAPATRMFGEKTLNLVGKIDYDETQVREITTRFPGRLDRLYVDYTGMRVKKGDHLVSIYSPELLSAQQELLQAVRSRDELRESRLSRMRASADETIEAAREKLRLWGLADWQIEQIEERGEPSDHLTIYAPLAGVVIEKHAMEGAYVDTGSPIYTIADLDHVWARLDAYESDLEWIRYGQEVAFTTAAYPGETFTG
ncbi:MAG: HlyD family efflux transporter periplasmic adaptor subunit, partial [Candidatus Eisenbacteria bacterium]|nr:HlyD family efflux transporter periplasmic adaptor subunit [Candidatus Eisenbacteria bacterium]